jgi:hypothetical protein
MNFERRDNNLINQPFPFNRITRDYRTDRSNRNEEQEVCEFCQSLGHNIIGCDDDRLIDFELVCRRKKSEFNRLSFISNNSRTYSQCYFRYWLSEEYMRNRNLIKAYAKKRTSGFTQLTNMFSIVNSIIGYIYMDQNFLRPRNLVERNIRYMNNNNTINNLIDFSGIGITSITHSGNDVINISAAFNIPEDVYVNIDLNQEQYDYKLEILLEPLKQLEKEEECSICYEKQEKKQFVKLECLHEFCDGCLLKIVKTQTPLSCALCRKKTNQLICYAEEVKNKFLQ